MNYDGSADYHVANGNVCKLGATGLPNTSSGMHNFSTGHRGYEASALLQKKIS